MSSPMPSSRIFLLLFAFLGITFSPSIAFFNAFSYAFFAHLSSPLRLPWHHLHLLWHLLHLLWHLLHPPWHLLRLLWHLLQHLLLLELLQPGMDAEAEKRQVRQMVIGNVVTFTLICTAITAAP